MSQCKLDDRPGEKIRRSRGTPVGIVPGRELPFVISAPAFDGPIVKDRTGVLTSRDDGHRPRALREQREDHAKKKPERRIRHRLAECTTTSGITRRVRSLPGSHGAASGSPRARFATIECPTCERARRYARRKPFFLCTAPTNQKRRRTGKTGARQAPSQQNNWWLGANTSISIITNRHALSTLPRA